MQTRHSPFPRHAEWSSSLEALGVFETPRSLASEPSGKHSSVTWSHIISLGGERQLASENERQVRGCCSMENACTSRWDGVWEPQTGQVQHAWPEAGSDLSGRGLPDTEDGSNGQGPLERRLESRMKARHPPTGHSTFPII